MHKNVSVADIEIDEVIGHINSVHRVYNLVHAPFCSIMGDTISTRILKIWWYTRAIPLTRQGIRDALYTIDISTPQVLLKKGYGLSLSDQYWICPKNQNLKWESINFFDNAFSDDVGKILLGQERGINDPSRLNLMSPSNSAEGQLRKAWKICDGIRYLLKEGNSITFQEVINEAIASKICDKLKIPNTPYQIIKLGNKFYSCCPDFIKSDTDLVSASQILTAYKKPDNISLYEHYINCVERLGIKDIRASLEKMITLDFIISNQDRHFNNFGLIRNAETLQWLSAAPIFDCGSSFGYLNAVIYEEEIEKCRSFAKTHSEQIKLVKDFSWLDLKKLDGIEEDFADLLSSIPDTNISLERKQNLLNLLRDRINALKSIIKSRAGKISSMCK
jgi:hypothetical protein